MAWPEEVVMVRYLSTWLTLPVVCLPVGSVTVTSVVVKATRHSPPTYFVSISSPLQSVFCSTGGTTGTLFHCCSQTSLGEPLVFFSHMKVAGLHWYLSLLLGPPVDCPVTTLVADAVVKMLQS